ncbi:MAG TPA: DMT family transporter [Pyrinomonadaceae bacterium]|nr:DMT family transporter [Pyrinomonadaceae bacterium]
MNVEPKSLAPAYIALSVGIVLTACSAIFVKIAMLPGTTTAFYRVLFAAAVAVPWCLWLQPSLPARKAMWSAFAGGVCFAATAVLWNSSLLVTSAANATLLLHLAPMWIGLSALLLFRERLGSYFWAGLVIALAGMALVVSGGTRQLASFNYGDVLAVGSSFFYALYLLVTQRVRATMDALTFFALAAASSVVVLLVTCVALGVPLSGFSARAWAALAAMGLVSHLGGYLAINYALGHMRATSVSVSLLSQPVITALLSIPLLGELLSAQQIIGGALVLGGIYLVNRRSSPGSSIRKQPLSMGGRQDKSLQRTRG